jgi:hypothetical protein
LWLRVWTTGTELDVVEVEVLVGEEVDEDAEDDKVEEVVWLFVHVVEWDDDTEWLDDDDAKELEELVWLDVVVDRDDDVERLDELEDTKAGMLLDVEVDVADVDVTVVYGGRLTAWL